MKSLIKATVALLVSIVLVISSANYAHAASNYEETVYAKTVESYTPGEFGSSRGRSGLTLGNPDSGYFGLGIGGDIVFSFGGQFSKQVTVWETTFGSQSSQSEYDEKVEVFVGNDLENWLSIGTIENIADGAKGDKGATLDIGNDNLYQYIKLVDRSQAFRNRNGFDINAVGVNMELKCLPVPAFPMQ